MDNEERDMSPIFIKDLGMRFPKEDSKEKKRFGLYECKYCEKEFETQTQDVKKGNIKSCGCQKYKLKHGMRQHRLYSTWVNMMRRCHNQKSNGYKDYGGRGISVCKHWHSIKNFIEDMYPSFEEGLTLDRIDVNGNYKPDNCRWTTNEIQARNTQKLRKNNKTGFRGVNRKEDINKYRTYIKINNKHIHLGYYHNPERGALAYDTYVRKHNLEHTKNFSDEEYYKLLEKYKNG